MHITLKKVALISSLIGLILLVAGIIYSKNLAQYTANLDSRAFNIGLVGEVTELNPALITTSEEILISSAMYEGLVTYDEAAKQVKPLLAKGWKYSTDGKSLTITLKKNILFHNGKPLTALDVKKSWEHNFSTTKDWTNISLFMSIAGIDERLEGKAPDISGIQALDKHTIKISFLEANAVFLAMLTNPIFWVYDLDDQVEIKPATGPFIYKDTKGKEELILIRNDKYHGSKPLLTALHIKSYVDSLEAFGDYLDNRLDYLDTVPLKEIKNLKSDDKYKALYIEKPLLETYSLGLNVNSEPYAGNYLLRRAFNYAIDRNAIIDDLLGGSYRPLKSPLPIGVNGYNNQMRGYTYDPEKAEELLIQAEYPKGEGLKVLTITYNDDEGHQAIALAVAQQLMELGLQVEVQALDWDYYKKQLEQTGINCFKLGWQSDYPDADSFLYSLYHSSKIGISNYSAYHNPQVDKILDAARAETKSQQERIKLLKRAEEIIVDDAPQIWLFQKLANKLISKDVKSLNVDSRGLLNWAEIELVKPSLDDVNDKSDNKV
ncbi:MAG: ABC transporter substrate-binding protein [Syntrophomonadaceae bacterium]|nr:ABC transporter substrate-binding protein [Syntrophomonadaceae bacterium]